MFLADFHVHSKYSRATSRDLDLEHLFIAAQRKGVAVVGTGDFTHPGWFAEIREKLVPTGTGLFELRPDIAARCQKQVPDTCRRPVRFLLTAEISNIYKKNERTRKNHNLVFLETLDAAEAFNRRLDRIGNIASDGRPILGLDARDLLEILLSVSHTGFLVPAHIWTPWFSLFGSKSGFDSVSECFEDLSDEIFAVETGLSSDPPMNWRVSDLDSRTLISNSDAHSPAKLAREATRFAGEQSSRDIRESLKSGDPDRFLGTVEFYPEEGKYHFDGHRKCGVRFSPEQSRHVSEKCPRCGRPLTLGVLHRVEQLADRPAGRRPERGRGFLSLVPLQDILSELLEVGPQAKKVAAATETLLFRYGSEFDILWQIEPERLESAPVPLLAEAIRRVRNRRVSVIPGYDGEFGTVRIFDPQERRRLSRQGNLFACPAATAAAGKPESRPADVSDVDSGRKVPKGIFRQRSWLPPKSDVFPSALNPEQQTALRGQNPATLVVAGPGTGKTRTLICRIAQMISEQKVPAGRILAVTFTNQAAREMSHRLAAMQIGVELPAVMTFHGFCLSTLQAHGQLPGSLIDEETARQQVAEAAVMTRAEGWKVTASTAALVNRIAALKQQDLPPDGPESTIDPALAEVYRRYQRLLNVQGLFDYEDLILRCCRLLEKDAGFRSAVCGRFHHLLIDEYQDLNPGQYRLVRLLVPAATPRRTIFAIGDPNQSIYGFRGSDAGFFQRFSEDYPNTKVVVLCRNYRSTETILQAAETFVSPDGQGGSIFSGIEGISRIDLVECRSERAEAVAVGRMIENEIGGTGFHAIDFGKVDTTAKTERSFADLAVLVRTGSQMDLFHEVLTEAGIPATPVRKKKTYDGPIRSLVSMVRLLCGHPIYSDVETAFALLEEGVGKKTLAAFKSWALQNRLSAKKALDAAWKVPVPGMARAAQKRFCRAYRKCVDLSSLLAGRSPPEVLFGAAEKTGLADRIRAESRFAEAFNLLIRHAGAEGLSIEALLSRLALETDTDALEIRSESVPILTMHGAKGLEFPVVFIAGCEDGLIPMSADAGETGDREEERRLFYVALTRAKERLVLCWSKKRRIRGRTQERRLSPFAAQIKNDLLCRRRPAEKGAAASRQRQLELFT